MMWKECVSGWYEKRWTRIKRSQGNRLLLLFLRRIIFCLPYTITIEQVSEMKRKFSRDAETGKKGYSLLRRPIAPHTDSRPFELHPFQQ